MKTNYLLSNKHKKTGWILTIIGIILFIIGEVYASEPAWANIYFPAIIDNNFFGPQEYFTLNKHNMYGEIVEIIILMGLFILALSKEKQEDEFISKIRVESLVWAMYINYAILLLSILFIFGSSALWVIILNMYSILIFFIIRFKYCLYKSKQLVTDEK